MVGELQQLKQTFSKIHDVNTLNRIKGSNKNITEFVTLFFSFDIVNSTKYKTIVLQDALVIIHRLFEELDYLMKENIIGVKRWRTIGDEIIFYLEIYNEEEIIKSIEKAFGILNEMIYRIKNEKIHILKNDCPKKYKYPEIISLKGTCWLALVGDDMAECKNVRYFSGAEGDKRLEFLGHDIDIGFRVSEHTRNRRMAINFELAYILYQNKATKNNLKIIGYEKLKGVWSERKYPIIWYHTEKAIDIEGTKRSLEARTLELFEDSFFYDEEDYCDLTTRYQKNRGENCLSLKQIPKIAKDLNIERNIEKIKVEIKNKDSRRLQIGEKIKETHFVIICLNNQKKSILGFKRKDGKIDFGCININLMKLDEKLENKVQEEYKKMCNLEILIGKIYKMFYFEKSNKIVTGFRFIGIYNEKEIKNFKSNHSKYIDYIELTKNNYLKQNYIDQEEFIPIIEELLNIEDKE
ncbi:MAG: hypothetical protein ACRCZR_08340 [Cetobacterium sp.]